jgi:hypothetical protein
MTERSTCGPIMETFLQALDRRPDLPPVQIIGGNGAAALLNSDTVIDLESRTISAPSSCDLPRIRADGSVRDLDTLVLSTDPGEVDAVRVLGDESIGGELKVSTFGLRTMAELTAQRDRPLRSTARIFLADRYVTTTTDAEGSPVFEGFKALFPFQVPITNEILEGFHLVLDGRHPVPTSHPGATILNYLTRSISGLRSKDAAKVEAMTENVLTRYPEISDWIHDGPGRDLLDLARILHTLSEPRRRARTRRLGTQLELTPYPLAALGDHPGFMASRRNWPTQRLIVDACHVKSRVLGSFESNTAIVGFWRKHIEDRVDGIIHNEP